MRFGDYVVFDGVEVEKGFFSIVDAVLGDLIDDFSSFSGVEHGVEDGDYGREPITCFHRRLVRP